MLTAIVSLASGCLYGGGGDLVLATRNQEEDWVGQHGLHRLEGGDCAVRRTDRRWRW